MRSAASGWESSKAVKGIHFLLTYTCPFECDHCFVYSSPRARGTFTLQQVRDVLDEARKIGTIEWIYFEGGEPTLFYPLMLEGIRLAYGMGFKTGVVTNAYWAATEEDAALWLRPLAKLGLNDLSISDDSLHGSDGEDSAPKRALAAAKGLGISCGSISMEDPAQAAQSPSVTDGGVMFKGRAAEKLTDGLPRRPIAELTACPDEDLEHPSRVHIDAYGNVHICQGISMGNLWETPLSTLVEYYNGRAHPICGPLIEGGPARLAAQYGVAHDEGYVDECHFCYEIRRALLEGHSQYLGPPQVYGLE